MQAVPANRPLRALALVAPTANPGVQVVLLRAGGLEGRIARTSNSEEKGKRMVVELSQANTGIDGLFEE